jgi:hypothetical protein
VKRLPKGFRQKRERMTNIDFLCKKCCRFIRKEFLPGENGAYALHCHEQHDAIFSV